MAWSFFTYSMAPCSLECLRTSLETVLNTMPLHDTPCWSCRAVGFGEASAWGRTETKYRGCCMSCFTDRSCAECGQFSAGRAALWCRTCENRLAKWCRRCVGVETLRLQQCARCLAKRPPPKCWSCLAKGLGKASTNTQKATYLRGCSEAH